MKLYLQRLAVAAFLVAIVSPAFSQNYPMPAKSDQPLVKCIGCTSRNASGENNDGLPLWPYSDPLVRHVGRLVDSLDVRDIQQPFRTVRARKMHIAEGQRGSAPPRVYMQLGSALGVYSLDPFFTTSVPSGMVKITSLYKVNREDPEKLLKWEGYVYPEQSGSGWQTFFMDGQDRFSDFDFDDRGLVYIATGPFGWGIVKDDGRSAGGQLPLLKQMVGDSDPSGFTPGVIFSVRTGNQYWAVTANTKARAVFDVTNPGSPMFRGKAEGSENSIIAWAKAADAQTVGTIANDGKVSIFTNDALVKGGTASTFSGKTGKFTAITADPDGTFWAASPSTLHRFRPSGGGYIEDTFPAGSGAFTIEKLNFGADHLVAVGRAQVDGRLQIELRLFKIQAGTPTEIDLGNFFTNHYHRSPSGYAQPKVTETNTIFGGHVYKQNGKTYLVYNLGGLSDVFEIQSGDSINASRRSGIFGTRNTYSQPKESGPFYGDILSFTSTSTNPQARYFVEWNFANPESGTRNTKQAQTGDNVEHQYTGLTTAGAISATKSVKVAADGDMEATVPVTMKVPTARIGVAGEPTVLVETDNATLSLLFGDKLVDASDGEVEGHYSAWTVDGSSQNVFPNQPVDAGNYGPHTATLTANYGAYDTSFTTVGSPFVRRVQNLKYDVRPFAAAFKPASKAGSTVTFKAAARKAASLTSIANWDVAWSIKNPAGADVVAPVSVSAAFGTIPNFDVTTAIPDGSVVTLTVSVPSELLPAEAANLASQTLTQTLSVPAPLIGSPGCTEVGQPCTFEVTNAAPDWTFLWQLKTGATVVKSATTNPFTYTINDPASYSISVVASTGVFDSATVSRSFQVTEPACGNPPAASMISIATSCDQCEVGEEVSMSPSVLGYNWQNCEQFEWTFGDGSAVLLTDKFTVTKKYTSSGSKTIKLRIKKGTEYSTAVSYTIKVGSSTPPPPPPPTCTSPSNITINYSGSKGCKPGTPCKAGELVTFSARRGTSSLLSCDSVSWTHYDGSTNNRMAFAEPGNYSVSVTVSNTNGTDSATASIPVVADNGGGGNCNAPANAQQVGVIFEGLQSGCNDMNPNSPCQKGEQINFSVLPFVGYQIQSCDSFEWDFGDGSAKKSGLDASHTYQTDAPSIIAKLRVYNSSNSTGNTISFEVRFSNVPAKPTPVLSFAGFPTTGSKGNAVTFTVNSNIPAAGWSWDFGDGKKDTQSTHVGTSSSITHVYASTGTYTVTVKARNAEDQTTNAPTNSATGTIKVDEIPEFRYLLPVVAHGAGQGGSVWRTDVQIYNPDPNVSAENTLDMTATFNGQQTQLHIAHSTFIFEDFMQRLTTADAQGPVIITTKAKHAPQIWTRTYNQASNGTFGQFIPAIRLDSAGGGSAVGEGRYFLAGLRNDARYRTNVGLVNPTAQPLTATIRAFDETGLPIANGTFTRTLNPFQLDQFPIGAVIQNFPADHAFSLEVEVGTGQWVIAYASFIDGGSNDPIFLQAIRESELVSEDYRTIVIPGVGHTGAWRSDVAIYNSNGRGITVDLAYHDATGSKVGQATNVPIGGGEFLLYADLLKQGVLGGDVPDGLGMLRVSVPTAVSTERFPMGYARTYNDDGSGKTYGQGIAAFAAARPNVSETLTGLIPGVRSKAGEYYTNVFVTNVTDAPVDFSIKVLDRTTGSQIREDVARVGAYQTITFGKYDLGGEESASLKIQATGKVWAYASVVDDRTKDPEYVPATPITP